MHQNTIVIGTREGKQIQSGTYNPETYKDRSVNVWVIATLG